MSVSQLVDMGSLYYMELIMPYFLTNKAWYTVSEDKNETLENFVFDDERDKDKRIFS